MLPSAEAVAVLKTLVHLRVLLAPGICLDYAEQERVNQAIYP